MRKFLLKGIVLIGILFTSNILAQNWTELNEVHVDVHMGFYGASVSIHGNYAVAGAIGNGNFTGGAYVLYFNGTEWVVQAELTVSDGSENDEFGNSVCISENTIVIGTCKDDDYGSSSGSAYVYTKSANGWEDMTETAKLNASDASENGRFGTSVNISGEYIFVGAPSLHGTGSVYVFEKPSGGWINSIETAKLTASDEGNNNLGCSVSSSGDQIVIGAYSAGSNGSVYVFEKPIDGWVTATETAKLIASDGSSLDYFGRSVGISGNNIVVGAWGDDDNGDLSGSAYVFVKPEGRWVNTTETAKLYASDGSENDYFGLSVSISNDNIVIGAVHDDDVSGSAYVFTKPANGWINMTETCKLKPSDSGTGQRFGCSVSISGENLIIGSYFDSDNRFYGGSTYFYRNAEPVNFNNIICQGEVFIYAVLNQEEGTTFQWQENTDGSWQNIDAETNDTLIISNVTLEMNNYQYRCIISGTENDTTEVATLIVNPIYNLSETVTINTGDSYTFPDGTSQTNITSQVVYTSNLQTVFGCDSIIETTVNVEDNSGDLFTKVIIDEAANFIFPIGAQLGDYDNDGDQDILVTDTMENIHIYENELNSFSREVSFPIFRSSSELVKWFDYDNDSDLDVFFIGDDSPGIKLFRNNSGVFSEISIEDFKAAQYGSFNAGDFNNDGYKDILITGSNSFDGSNSSSSLTQIIENNGTSFSEVYKNMLPGTDWNGYAAWGDFDNDNYLDIVLSGNNYDNDEMVSKIYRNTGSSFIEIYPNSLAKAQCSKIACADYNNDGLLDILLFGSDWEYGGESFTKLYKNIGSGFTEVVGANISGVPFSSAWGDYDNDGDLDLVLSGDKIFRNDGDDSFTQVSYDAVKENYGKSCWGDYDKDGDLDIISVYGDLLIYVNNSESKNNSALAPQNTSSDILGKEATLKWDKTTDAETPQDGLTYNIEVYKSSKSKAQTLYAKIERIQYCENGYTLKNLPNGEYFWKVQAFDTGLKGGEFSEEKTFTIGESGGSTYYESESICDGETLTFGSQELSTVGEYTEIFQAVDGSDSTVVLTLIVNSTYNLNETVTINTGDSYTFPDGTSQTNITSQVVYTSNLQTVFGCDSIIETTVNVEQPPICYFYETVAVCSGSDYTFPDGTTQENITSLVVYESLFESTSGCDTIIETTINVNPTHVTNLTDSICNGESVQVGFGQFSYTGLYGVYLQNRFGCDSIVNMDLTVFNPIVNLGDDAIINTNDTIILDAGEDFKSYYWNTGETSQTILFNGSIGTYNYNVLVTDDIGCIGADTIIIAVSDLTDIISINELGSNIKLYPNPTSGKLNIEWIENNEEVEISIFDITGKLLLQKELNSKETKMLIDIPGDSGVYFIRISTKTNTNTFKIIKN